MEYIRTENEIGILLEKDNEVSNLEKGYYFKHWRCDKPNENWKQADTIEELCDCIVEICLSGNRVYNICDFDDNFKNKCIQTMNKSINKGYKVFYGAIWTDKGLIYVAKMNEKGELELL